MIPSNNENESFKFTYSAKEQDELRKIREKYQNGEESKLERLRRLDKNVAKKSVVLSLTLGILGTLILGFGMSLILSDIAAMMGMSSTAALILGIILGIVGGAVASVAYPIYNYTLKKERERIAPEILRLTDEFLK